jgi:hypothetical protein
MDRVTWALGLSRVEEEDVLTPNGIVATKNTGVGEAGATVTGNDNDNSWVMAIQNYQTTGNTTAPAPRIQQGPPVAIRNTLPQMPMEIPAGPPPGLPSKFLGIGMALKCLGHVMYYPAMLEAELSLQRDIQGNNTRQAAFRGFMVNYTQLRVYLLMLGDQKTVTMIHTVGAFYSLKSGTNAS